MRLRDPLPVQSAAFARAGSGGSWLIPAILGVLAVAVVVVVVILAMTRENVGGDPGRTTDPTIDVPSNSRTLPTNVPTVTR
jgi:serine/threonine protein kinase, bacterial